MEKFDEGTDDTNPFGILFLSQRPHVVLVSLDTLCGKRSIQEVSKP
jgi:hypothetical protein